MDKALELLATLSDGCAHSGAGLAAHLGVSRAAIWNRVRHLQDLGVDIFAVRGKGYQLAQRFEFLAPDRIEAALGARARALLTGLTVSTNVDSTNQRLLDAAQTRSIHAEAWLAEYQSAGRGRRGDRWLAPPGGAVCLSLGWRFEMPPRDLGALSLAVGVAIARALRAMGARNIALKWPNDLQFEQRKLGGILIEMRSELSGPCIVVIGVGVNVTLGEDLRARIDQPTASLLDACVDLPTRNQVAAAMLDQLMTMLDTFGEQGFASLLQAWRALDALADQAVELALPDRIVSGIARGVDSHGMLLIEHGGKTEHFLSGHVRLRAGV